MSLCGSIVQDLEFIRAVILLGSVSRATTVMLIVCILIQVIVWVIVRGSLLLLVRGSLLLLVPFKLALLGG
jgi:hypothetical protein